jgi:hypothetical protein
MTKVQIEISDALVQRFTRYQQHLSKLLELDLIEWKNLCQEEESKRLHQLLAILVNDGKIILPTPVNQPYQRTTPVKLPGQPLSEIIIKQRGTM